VSEKIRTYKDLRVYQNSVESAMKIFEITKAFPVEERFSLVVQILLRHGGNEDTKQLLLQN
jgi:hypothetical protein